MAGLRLHYLVAASATTKFCDVFGQTLMGNRHCLISPHGLIMDLPVQTDREMRE